jgi:hypothetical protein
MNILAKLREPRLKSRALGELKAARLHILVVLVACALSFGLRCYYVFVYIDADSTFQQIGGDAEDFLRIAYSLSQTDTFAEPTTINVKESLLRHQHPQIVSATEVRRTAWRPPLWPLALAAMMRVANYDLSEMLYLRFALDSLTLVLFYLLLLKLALRPASRVVALLLFALHPAWLIYSGTFFSEPLTLLVHVAFALSILSLLGDNETPAYLIVAGVLAGLVVLEHPFYIFFPLIAAALFYQAKLIRLRSALLVAALMCATVSPWVLRNMLLFHTTTPVLTTSSGINLAKGWNEAFLSLYRDTTADVVLSESVIGAGSIKSSDQNEQEKSEAYTRRAINFTETNWRLIPAIAARKLAGAIDPFPETQRDGALETGRAAFQIISFLPLMFVLFNRRARQLRLLAIALLSAYLLMSVFTMGTIRYRFPLIWIELLSVVWIAEYGLRRLAGRWPSLRANSHKQAGTRAQDATPRKEEKVVAGVRVLPLIGR